MRIAVWPADEQGCGHYRLIFPARALLAQGADVRIDRTGPVCEWSQDWSRLSRPPSTAHIVKVRPYDADVVVIQRPARQHWTEMIPHLQAQGIRVVVDVDDLFDSIPKGNRAWQDYQSGGRYPAVAHSWIDEACKVADVVTCTTPLLLKRYGYGHGIVIPNLVPESYLSIDSFHYRNTVGWSGIVGTHTGDLELTDGAVAQAIRGDWEFHTIGPVDGVQSALKLDVEPSATGYLAFESWAPAVAELDIGIVPLGPSLFNEAKSALKASEFAAVGVPVVMSPTPDNLRLHRLGVGLVAESRGQWNRLISKLIGSDDFRAEIAGRGREVMATQTYEAHAGRWLDAWQGQAQEMAA